MYNGKGLRAHLKQHWFESHMFNQEPCLCCSQYHTRKQTNGSLAAHWSVHPTSCPLSRWFEGKTRGITSLNIQPTLSMHNRQSSVYGMWHSIRLITPTDNLIKVVSPQTCMYCEDITCLPDTTCPWQLIEEPKLTGGYDDRSDHYNILDLQVEKVPVLGKGLRTVLDCFLLKLFHDRPDLLHARFCPRRITIRSCERQYRRIRAFDTFASYYRCEYSLELVSETAVTLLSREICYSPRPTRYHTAESILELRKIMEEVVLNEIW